MPTQLTLDFTPQPRPIYPVFQDEQWLDVTDIARGLGFTILVEISPALNDALQSRQEESEDAYDQRLYDCLWLPISNGHSRVEKLQRSTSFLSLRIQKKRSAFE